MRINPAVRWIKPKSPEENGLGSEVYICSEGKELICASSGNQIGGHFGPNRGALSMKYTGSFVNRKI